MRPKKPLIKSRLFRTCCVRSQWIRLKSEKKIPDLVIDWESHIQVGAMCLVSCKVLLSQFRHMFGRIIRVEIV